MGSPLHNYIALHRVDAISAIYFLMNGGNIFALQVILGHVSLEMVKRYLTIAMADIEAVPRNASFVNSWPWGQLALMLLLRSK
jgi:hypothetical protein